MSLSRRGLLGGLVAALAAPTIIRTPGLLMPVKRIALPYFRYGVEQIPISVPLFSTAHPCVEEVIFPDPDHLWNVNRWTNTTRPGVASWPDWHYEDIT